MLIRLLLTRCPHPQAEEGRRVLFSHFTDQYRLTLHNHHDMARIEFPETDEIPAWFQLRFE